MFNIYSVKDFFARIYCAIRGHHAWAMFAETNPSAYTCHDCHTFVR